LAYILNIETATKNCSVSVASGGDVLALVERNDGSYSHAENLHRFMARALDDAKIEKTDLAAVAVSMGPGSYTGLRIGVSAAKGLCFALDIPLIAIPTLDILARSVMIDEGHILPLLDARRMEVYSSVYSADYEQVEEVSAQIIDTTSFTAILDQGKVYFLGDGALKCQSVIQHSNAVFKTDTYPSAKEMAQLSWTIFCNKAFVDVAYFEPFYLKDFIATTPKKLI
jgi:tRNA threonylcarbamoyladenosine biosynthesis protein TsaB